MFRIKDYHLHLPHFTFDNTKNLRLLYAIRIIRDLVNKIAMFFLPIFLFTVGDSSNFLDHTNFSHFQKGILLLCLYYIVYGLIALLFAIPSAAIYKKIGYQRAFVFSFLLRCVYFALMFYARNNIIFLIPAVLADAINSKLFWPGYFVLLSDQIDKKKIGADVGLIQFLLQVLSIVAPAVSGLVAYKIGIEFLFLVGLILTLLSSILALSMESYLVKSEPSFKEFIEWLKEIRFAKLGASFMGKYFYDATIYIWPLYVLSILGSIDRVGYLYTLSLFLAMTITFFMGDYIDHHKSKKPFYLSGGFLSLITLSRAQAFTPFGIATIDIFDKLTANVYGLFFDTMFMVRSKGHSSSSFFVYREMILDVSTILFWSVLGLFFIFFDGWRSLFVIAALGVLVSLLIKDSKHG